MTTTLQYLKAKARAHDPIARSLLKDMLRMRKALRTIEYRAGHFHAGAIAAIARQGLGLKPVEYRRNGTRVK